MNRKPFDRGLYNKYDQLAKSYAKRELGKLGYTVEDNPNKTGVDLIVKHKGTIIFYVECEIKKALDKPFHYKTVQLPERKTKYIGLKYPTLFTLWSSDGKKLICSWDKFVRQSPLKEVWNKYVQYKEFFYQIPVRNCNKSIAEAVGRKWRRRWTK